MCWIVSPVADTLLLCRVIFVPTPQVLVAERGPLVFVFNWHPHEDYEGLKVAAPEPGELETICSLF